MYRRDFLAATTSAGILGLTASAVELAAAPQSLTLGIGTYAMKTFDTERAIDVVAETGFDSIELTIMSGWDADPARLNDQRRVRLRKQLAARGLRLTSLGEHLHVDQRDRTRAQRLDRLRRAAELAHDLSPAAPPLLQTTLGGSGRWEDLRPLAEEELREWLRVAEAGDLVIAVKPHRGGAFSRPGQAAELIKSLGEPRRLRMCYDYSHYDFRDMTLAGTIQTALPHVGHIAVKDIVMQDGRPRFVLPGAGDRIDYPTLLRLFFEGGYRGDISCEVSSQVWSQAGYDALAAVQTCYSNLASAFEQSGVPRG